MYVLISLSRNRFYVSGGSYGGVYVPNIATVIQEQNALSIPGNLNINLEAVLVSNPLSVCAPSSYSSRTTLILVLRIQRHTSVGTFTTSVTSTTSIIQRPARSCRLLFHAVSSSSTSTRTGPQSRTRKPLSNIVRHSRMAMLTVALLRTFGVWLVLSSKHGPISDLLVQCHLDDDRSKENPVPCHPSFTWALDFFGKSSTRTELGIPDGVNFTSISLAVHSAFTNNTDMCVCTFEPGSGITDVFEERLRIIFCTSRF